jgi:hypothetical protein
MTKVEMAMTGQLMEQFLTEDRFGSPDGAYAFDGNGQHISIPHSNELNFGPSNLTISFSISANVVDETFYIIGKSHGNNGTQKWAVTYNVITGERGIQFHVNPGNHWIASTKQNLPLKTWQHITVTKTGTRYDIYIDGEHFSNGIGPASNGAGNTAPLTIGSIEGAGFVNGTIDDIRIYNRAFSEEEVLALYKKEASSDEGIKISKDLEDQAAEAGKTAAFEVKAYGKAYGGALSYQWLSNGEPFEDETSPSLTLEDLTLEDSGSYQVRIIRANGFTILSRVVRLSVYETGAPLIHADNQILITDVESRRGDQSVISIASSFEDAMILYTTDESEPDFGSTIYTEPFTVTETTTVRAVAYNADFSSSASYGPVTVTIVPTYEPLAFVQGEGTVSFTPDKNRYLHGETVRVSVSPAIGWRFVKWRGSVKSESLNITLNMTGPRMVQAILEPIPQYQLTASTAGGGVINWDNRSPYYEDTKVTLKAEPEEGWQFMHWKLGVETFTNAEIIITMDSNKGLEAVFGTTITPKALGGGKVVVWPSEGALSVWVEDPVDGCAG